MRRELKGSEGKNTRHRNLVRKRPEDRGNRTKEYPSCNQVHGWCEAQFPHLPLFSTSRLPEMREKKENYFLSFRFPSTTAFPRMSSLVAIL